MKNALVLLWLAAAAACSERSPSPAVPPSPPAQPPPAPPPAAPGLRALAIIDDHPYVLLLGNLGAPSGEPTELNAEYRWRPIANGNVAGTPVRLIGDRECDGSLASPGELSFAVGDTVERSPAAAVRGCDDLHDALIAVLHPRGEPLREVPREQGQTAWELARHTVNEIAGQDEGGLGQLQTRIGNAIYVTATESSCAEGGDDGCLVVATALTRVVGDAAPEVVIAYGQTEPALVPASGSIAITDWNGDGTPELTERVGEGEVVRMTAPSSSDRAGERRWTATCSLSGCVRPTIEPAGTGSP